MLEAGVFLMGVAAVGALVFHAFDRLVVSRPAQLWKEPDWGKVSEPVRTGAQVQQLLRDEYPDSGDDWMLVLGGDE